MDLNFYYTNMCVKLFNKPKYVFVNNRFIFLLKKKLLLTF